MTVGAQVAALFIDLKGPYPEMLGAELCWDEKRDARGYTGTGPVIVHPPCGRWCAMARQNERRWGAKVGEDGGCFAAALEHLGRCGGVLEHPKSSIAFKHFGIPKPKSKIIGWQQVAECVWVCEVWQSAYGHLASKATWLVYVGARAPFQLRWDRPRGTHQIGGGVHTGNRLLPRLDGKLTHISPPEFARELVKLAEWSRLPT